METPRRMLDGHTQKLSHIILIGMSLSLIFSIILTLKPDLTYGVDGEVFYVGARLLASGHDPYDGQQLQNASRKAVPGGIVIGTPSQEQIALPALLAVDTLFCWLKWPLFLRLGVFADALLIPMIASLCLQYLRGPSSPAPLWISSFCIALFPPTWKVVAVGQISLLVLLCVLVVFRTVRHRRPLFTGPLCFLSLLKFTCVLPALLFLSLRERGRQRSALIAGGALFTLINAVIVLHLGVRTFAQEYHQNMALVFSSGRINDAYGAGQGVRIDLESILAAIFTRHRGAIAGAFLCIAAALPLCARLRDTRKIGLPEISSLCLLSLVCFYHRPYDAVFAVPTGFLLYQRIQERGSRALSVGGVLIAALCYGSLGDHNVIDPILRVLHAHRPAFLNAAIILLAYVFVTFGFVTRKRREDTSTLEEPRLTLI